MPVFCVVVNFLIPWAYDSNKLTSMLTRCVPEKKKVIRYAYGYISVCMHMCDVCIHVCMHVCMHVCVCMCMHVYVCVMCACVCMHVCILFPYTTTVHIYIYTYSRQYHTPTLVDLHLGYHHPLHYCPCPYTHELTYIYMYTHMHSCAHVFIHVCVCKFTCCVCVHVCACMHYLPAHVNTFPSCMCSLHTFCVFKNVYELPLTQLE